LVEKLRVGSGSEGSGVEGHGWVGVGGARGWVRRDRCAGSISVPHRMERIRIQP
jgi:hypothetical protein